MIAQPKTVQPTNGGETDTEVDYESSDVAMDEHEQHTYHTIDEDIDHAVWPLSLAQAIQAIL